MVIAILIWLAVINTVGVLFGIYGYGVAKNWWQDLG
jgi:hypothetical protein